MFKQKNGKKIYHSISNKRDKELAGTEALMTRDKSQPQGGGNHLNLHAVGNAASEDTAKHRNKNCLTNPLLFGETVNISLTKWEKSNRKKTKSLCI